MSDEDLELGQAIEQDTSDAIDVGPRVHWFTGPRKRRILEREDAERRRLEAEERRKIEDERNAIRQEAERRRFIERNPHLSVLDNLPEEKQTEVALTLLDIHVRTESAIRKVRNDALDELRSLFGDLTEDPLPDECLAGSRVLMMAHKAFGGPLRRLLTHYLESDKEVPVETSEILQGAMLDISEISLLDERSTQRWLWQVNTNQLALALKGAAPEVKDKVFRNMSKRAAALLMEDMDYMGPKKKSEVQQARDEILAIIIALEERGDIVIPEDGDELVM